MDEKLKERSREELRNIAIQMSKELVSLTEHEIAIVTAELSGYISVNSKFMPQV
jgi:hypothetical protein